MAKCLLLGCNTDISNIFPSSEMERQYDLGRKTLKESFPLFENQKDNIKF